MSDHIDVSDRKIRQETGILDAESLDPSLHYRFVQERPASVARAKLKGYRIVRPSKDGVRTLLEQEDETPQDIIKDGDRILMVTTKARHETFHRERTERANARLRSNDRKVRDMAKERGVKLYEQDEEDDE